MKGLRTSKSKTNKIIAAMITAAFMVATAAVSISASDFIEIELSDYGIWHSRDDTTGSWPIDYPSLDSSIEISYYDIFGPYINISFEPDHTYQFTFSFTANNLLSTNISNQSNQIGGIYYSSNKISSGSLLKNYSILSDTSYLYNFSYEKNIIKLSITINSNNIDTSISYLYIQFIRLSQLATTFTYNGISCTCLYDPDASYYYSQILSCLDQIQKDNINYYTNALDVLNSIYSYGSDYPVPNEAATKLNNSVSSMSSAESALSSKSDQLMSEVSDTWSSNKQDVKSYATTLKPAAAQVNQLFLSITSSLPTEVKILFVVIPMLLFIGWLIGRIDK